MKLLDLPMNFAFIHIMFSGFIYNKVSKNDGNKKASHFNPAALVLN